MIPSAPPIYTAKRVAPKPPIDEQIKINLINITSQINSIKISLTLLEKKLKDLKDIVDDIKKVLDFIK